MKIQNSKHISPLVLAFSIVCKKNLLLDGLPDIQDVKYMLDVMKELEYEIKQEGNLFYIKANDYNLDDWRSFEANIRQNILFIAASLYQSKTIWPLPHGDVIGARPIEGYFDQLNNFGMIATVKDTFIEVNKLETLYPSSSRLPVDSTGITVVVMLILIRLHNEYIHLHDSVILENISVDLEIEWFIMFLNNNSSKNAFKYIHNDKRIIFYPKKYLPLNEFKYSIPYDRVVLFDMVLFIAMQQCKKVSSKSNKIQITKHEFESILGHPSITVLNELGVSFTYSNNFVLISAKNMITSSGNKLYFDAKKYPYISTDMLPILITYTTLLGYKVYAKDVYFEDRVSLLFEQINKVKESETCIIWESSNIRQSICGIMFLVYSNRVKYVMDYNNSIFRGYEKNFIANINEVSGIKISTQISKNGVKFKK